MGWVDVFIGLGTGLLTGLIVNKYFEKKSRKEHNEKIFLKLASLYHNLYYSLSSKNNYNKEGLIAIFDQIDFISKDLYDFKLHGKLHDIIISELAMRFFLDKSLKIWDIKALIEKDFMRELLNVSSNLESLAYRETNKYRNALREKIDNIFNSLKDKIMK
jgi:hypothetical protein